MRTKNSKLPLALSLVIACFGLSCKKQDDFLNVKPNQALATITTLADAQLLVNNESIFNDRLDPSLGEISTDDYYALTANWNNWQTPSQNAFIWNQQLYPAGVNINDWSTPYHEVYYANTILDALPAISYTSSQQGQYNQVKGSALFFRSWAFYNLLQVFAMPYDSASADNQLGIPLKLTSDLTTKSVRASVKTCYDQIIQDLQQSLALIPLHSTYPTQPSKPAADAFLSRIYLSMGNYDKAFQYADTCLSTEHNLQDFNQLDPNAYPVYLTYSPEDIFHTSFGAWDALVEAEADSNLYNSYDNNDLRKSIYFYYDGVGYEPNSQFDFHGDVYSGLSANETYLTRAECYARAGNTAAAMKDLNTLLATRWKTGTFINYSATSADDALVQILKERRKELWVTGVRWTDLRRLNKDPRFAITLSRVINGITYTLPPNDPRYALPIPDNEITISGIPQNQR